MKIRDVKSEVLMNTIRELYLNSPKDFLLIEIGANDGYCCDRMWNFVLTDKPKAIMVEPIIDYFDKLKSNYSHLNNIEFENIAISNNDGTAEMRYIPEKDIALGKVKFRLENQPHLFKEHWAGGLGSLYENKNNLACPELKKFEKKVIVQTKTFDYLFEKYNIDKYKNIVIQTDCEGHDLVLLKSFPFDKVTPKIYISEIYFKKNRLQKYGSNLLYTKKEYQEAIKILKENKYKLYRQNDLIGVLDSNFVNTSQFPKSLSEKMLNKLKQLRKRLN